MIIFPNLPEPGDDLCGILSIPEEIDFDFHEGPSEDEFIKAMIEIMSKPMKGGTHGENSIKQS